MDEQPKKKVRVIIPPKGATYVPRELVKHLLPRSLKRSQPPKDETPAEIKALGPELEPRGEITGFLNQEAPPEGPED